MDDAPAGLDPELVLMWRNGARATTGGPPVVGDEVAIRGFAKNSGVTAVVYRGNILVRCLDRQRWDPELEGEFVVVRGVLVRRDAPPIEEFQRGESISFLTLFLHERPGAGLFELPACDVTRGATNADAPADAVAALRRWEGLKFPAGVATIGAEVVLTGTVRRSREGPDIEGILVPCVPPAYEGRRLQVRGRLEYRPVPWLRGVSFDEMANPGFGPWGSFFLRTCDLKALP